MAKLNNQPDQFWKELIQRKNQEILDKFVESFEEPVLTSHDVFKSIIEDLNHKIPSHPSPPPAPPVKKDKVQEEIPEWKKLAQIGNLRIYPEKWKLNTYSESFLNYQYKFTVFDLNDQELGKVKTKQEAINLFMERYPQFDKKAVDPFIIQI